MYYDLVAVLMLKELTEEVASAQAAAKANKAKKSARLLAGLKSKFQRSEAASSDCADALVFSSQLADSSASEC